MATVSFTSAMAVIEGESGSSTILEAIRRQGFEGEYLPAGIDLAETRSRMELAQSRTVGMWRRRAIIALGIWIPLETMHWTLGGAGSPWLPWTMLVGAAVVLGFAGGGFYASAWTAAKRGGTNMDTLIAIGATTAFVWSLIVFVAQRVLANPEAWASLPLYFAESASATISKPRRRRTRVRRYGNCLNSNPTSPNGSMQTAWQAKCRVGTSKSAIAYKSDPAGGSPSMR